MSGYRSKSAFSKGVGHFRRIFHREGASPTNQCWCLKTRMIAVSCDIKIAAVHHLVLSQYTRLTDKRQTDGRTELRQQYRALHYMQSHGKNRTNVKLFWPPILVGRNDPDFLWQIVSAIYHPPFGKVWLVSDFRPCDRFSLSSVQRARRVRCEKKEERRKKKEMIENPGKT